MPFAASSDSDFYKIVEEAPLKGDIQNEAKNKDNNGEDNEEEKDSHYTPLLNPSRDMMYSFLKKPLDYYLGDSNGIFDLDLYQITINDNVMKKVFWKNVEFLDMQSDYYKQTVLTLTCVNALGIEYKEKKEIKLGNNNFDIKIFNLFFKKNVPFNYNMTSNNGWLELFLDDKYDIQEADKFTNFQEFIENNKTTRYYEEYNLPQTDIETRFKNYKIKNILIESNSPMVIRCDDYLDLNYYDKVDLTTAKKGSGELKLKIKIEPYLVNDEKFSIPVATFTTI